MNDSIGKPLQRQSLVTMVQKWTASGSELKKIKSKSNPACHPDRTSSDEQLPIDFDSAIAEFMGEKEILLTVLDKFIRRAGAQIKSIRAHIAHQNYRRIASEAHAIKGGAANLLALKLADIAAELENAAMQKPCEIIPELVEALDQENHRLRKYIERMIS